MKRNELAQARWERGGRAARMTTVAANDAARSVPGMRGSIVGLFLLKKPGVPPDGGPLLASIEGQLWALAFSDRPRALASCAGFGVEAEAFYVCAANTDEVVGELRAAGARGYIVDYDPANASFAGAGAL